MHRNLTWRIKGPWKVHQHFPGAFFALFLDFRVQSPYNRKRILIGKKHGSMELDTLLPEVPALPAVPCRPSRWTQLRHFLTAGDNIQRLLFLLGPWLAFLMVEILNKNNPFTALTPTQVTLNAIWYYLIFWLVRMVTGRRLLGAGLAAGLCFFAGLANHYVLTFRGRIIFPCDLLGLQTALNVAADYDYTLTAPVYIAAAILLCYWAALLALQLCTRPRGRQKLRWVTVAASCTAIGIYIYIFLFTALLPSIGIYAQQWKTQANGFLLNFMAALRYSFVSAPEEYSADAAEAIAARYPASEGSGQVPENLIIIMNESFADMQASFPNLELSEDPLAYYHALTENTVKGTLVPPVTGGGTANVEFEALTGGSLAFLPANTVAYQLYLYDGIPSLVSQMEDYHSIAFHPYLSSGWNRTSVYPWMGFDAQYYEEDVVDREDIRQYVSDSCDYKQLYRWTEETEEPTFIFNVTMQNHSGYTQGWTNLERTVKVENQTKGSKTATTQFFSLMEQSDRALRELIEYYAASDETTMIVFFGDHQPPLGNDFYEELYGKPLDQRTTAEVLQQYETPFFIWANYDIPEAEGVRISSNYLSILTRQLAGLPLSGFDALLSELMEVLPVATTVGYVTADGTVYERAEDLPEDIRTKYEEYRLMAYNYLFDEHKHPDGFYSPAP